MEEYNGKTCPHCNADIAEGDTGKACPDCGAVHHEGCWDEHQGCATCANQTEQEQTQVQDQPVEQAAEPAQHQTPDQPEAVPGDDLCPHCATPFEAEQKFCGKCGAFRTTPERKSSIHCDKCGVELLSGAAFCPKCGEKVAPGAAEAIRPAVSQTGTAGFAAGGRNKNTMLIGIAIAAVAVIAAIIIIVAIVGGAGGPNFQGLYNEYCISTWAEVGSDGSYLSIDTNPYDEDDNGVAYYSAYVAIQNVNEALGLPESLLTDMGSTTGADGKQTETFGSITVSWKYHPDKGLEVTYKK